MSSEILEQDTLAFTGTTPWHGLGKFVDPGASHETWVQQSGLVWSIDKEPVQYLHGERLFEMPDRFVMKRSDTGHPLCISSHRFNPVQPRQVLEFFRDIVRRNGFSLEVVGSLKNGLYLWGLAKVGKLAYVGTNDPMRAYLLLSTVCQPGIATTGRFTGVRVVCNNTLQMALAEGGSNVARLTHLEEFDPARVQDMMGLGVSSFERFMQHARRLAMTKITNEEALDYFTSVAGDPKLEPDHPDQPLTLMRLQNAFLTDVRTQQLTSSKGTMWGALNCVTNYIDFGRPNRGTGGRLVSAWFGSGRKMKEEAWNTAVRYAEKGSLEVTGS